MAKAEDGSKKTQGPGRLRSDFPKDTLEKALRVAEGLESANGGLPLPPTEVAIAIDLSPGSSKFREILSSSIRYGLTSGSYNSPRVGLENIGRDIVEPKGSESRNAALIAAALFSPTFKALYDYLKGKKLPEAQFFENTVVRDFGVPREHAAICVKIFRANLEFVGLLRTAKTGVWVSADPVGLGPSSMNPIDEMAEQDEEPELANDGDRERDVPPIDRAVKESSLKNAIFLGHGKNRKPLEQLEKILGQYKIPYKVAVDEPNKGRPISQKVADTMKECGAAILIFTADEEFIDADGNKFYRPNENVVYELGASSVLYGGKIVIFKEDGVELSTNFRDIGYISFQTDQLSAKMNELFGELIAFGLIKVTVGA